MRPNERRQAIIEILCRRRKETMKNLASEFGVSLRTINYDIEILSLSYPLVTSQGKYGGVAVMDGYYLGMKYLNPTQVEVLERLRVSLINEDQAVIDSILNEFAPKR